eukprot:gene9957-11007_t
MSGMKALLSLLFFLSHYTLQLSSSRLNLRSNVLPLPSISSFFQHSDHTIQSLQNPTSPPIPLSSLVQGGLRGNLLIFLSHCADLSSFELAQEIRHYSPQIEDAGISLAVVTLGSIENAKEFAKLTALPSKYLYVDSTAAIYRDLGFSRGPLPTQPVSPYLRLGAMLMGIGSPGTIEEVLRGYLGDRKAPSAWIHSSLRNYQRPFELATMRLQNMIDILQHWSTLAPQDTNLLTQLGGAYAFNPEGEIAYEFQDPALLKYVEIGRATKSLGLTLKDQ